jgi:hypothetical protein
MNVVIPSNRSLKQKKRLPPPVLAKTFDTKIEYPNHGFEVTHTDLPAHGLAN